jgi:hypothetical protein
MNRKHLILATTMVVIAAVAFVSLQAGRTDRTRLNVGSKLVRQIYDFYGVEAAHEQALYVGAETCLACHSGPNAVHGYDTSGWRNTFHAFPYKTVEDDKYSMVDTKGIVADSDQNGVDDFKDGLDMNTHPVFGKFAPYAPVLGYSDESGYTMKIGDVTYQIFFAWGGNGLYKQRFVVKIPVSDRPTGMSRGAYISPLQYNEKTHEWVEYHPEHWWDADGNPTITPGVSSTYVAGVARSFDKRCAGCHFTGTEIKQDEKGEWVGNAAPVVLLDPEDRNYIDFNGDGIREMTHISCEACHGPGSWHVMGHGDPDFIISPEQEFDAQQANDACGQCHVRGSSSDGTLGYLWDEQEDHPYVLGDLLDPYFTPNPGLWPDGKTSRQHHQQWHDLYESSKPTFEFHMVTCFECHDLHVANKHNIREFIKEEVDGEDIVIATENDDNTLCLACHATHGDFEEITVKMVSEYDKNIEEIGKIVSAHSNHPYSPERRMGLSRCSKCHMPKTAKSAINYDIHSHTFEAISSEKTLMYQAQGGMPNSCAVSCHRNIIDIFANGYDPDIGKWTEDSDVDLAEWLLDYYGPDGKWWKHSEGDDSGE